MKKLLALILASLMIFALASCGNTENNETTDTSSSSTETTSGSETTGSETTGETTGSEETTGKPEEPETPASLEDIIDGIYEKSPVEIMVATIVIDLTNAMSLKGATGIEASVKSIKFPTLNDGKYIVETISTSFDTRGNDWFNELRLTREDIYSQ